MSRSQAKNKDATYVPEIKLECETRELSRRNRGNSTINDASGSGRKYQPWVIEEKVALLDAIKKHGCADYKGISETMGIRDEMEVKNYLEKNMERVRKSVKFDVDLDDIDPNDKSDDAKIKRLMKTRTNNDLWKTIMSNMISSDHKSPDYSHCIVTLLKQFAEEEEECTEENHPNFKNLYLFLAECCAGNFTADLNSMDALVMHTTITKIHKCILDWNEEEKFIKGFMGTNTFIPTSYQKVLDEGSPYEIEQMHEQMRKLRKVSTNGIPLDDWAFNRYHQHMKIRENINPLGVNPSMLAEEEMKMFSIIEKRLEDD